MIRTSFALGVACAAVFLLGSPLGADQAAPKPAAAPAASAGPVLLMDTVKGLVEIQTSNESPKSLQHILDLVKKNFYRGHRVFFVQPYAIQFGDPYTRDATKADFWGTGGSGQPVGVAEPSKGKFDRGAVGLAYRQNDKPTAADSQMFILKAAQPSFTGKYAMIGKVTKGMEIVDKIEVKDVIRNITIK